MAKLAQLIQQPNFVSSAGLTKLCIWKNETSFKYVIRENKNLEHFYKKQLKFSCKLSLFIRLLWGMQGCNNNIGIPND